MKLACVLVVAALVGCQKGEQGDHAAAGSASASDPWDKAAPGPELPKEVVGETRARYVEAFERLTGFSFDDYLADPEVVLR